MLRKRAKPWDKGKAAGTRMRVSKKPWKSRAHLDRVKAEPCLARYLVFVHCGGPMDPHHCRKLLPSGLLPRHDYFAVPLCRAHHRCMDGNERAVWSVWGIDPTKFIARFSEEGRQAIAALKHKD